MIEANTNDPWMRVIETMTGIAAGQVKTIAIIGRTLKETNRYKKEYVDGFGAKVIQVTRPVHVVGFKIDAVIEMKDAYLNKKYDEIVKYVKTAMTT